MPVQDVSAAMPTSKHRRTFHSKPPGVDGVEGPVESGTDVQTSTWNAGLASDGISKEKVVRSVFNVNEE